MKKPIELIVKDGKNKGEPVFITDQRESKGFVDKPIARVNSVEQRRQLVMLHFFTKNWSPKKIAEEIGCNPTTVHADIASFNKTLQKAGITDINIKRFRNLVGKAIKTYSHAMGLGLKSKDPKLVALGVEVATKILEGNKLLEQQPIDRSTTIIEQTRIDNIRNTFTNLIEPAMGTIEEKGNGERFSITETNA